MAHSITAIIGPFQAIAEVIHAAGSPPATSLTSGMTIIPLGEAQIDRLSGNGPGELVDGFGYLSLGLERALATLATRGAFAYVETEYHGGIGEQAAVVFSPGNAPVPYIEQPNPINSALKSLGVEAGPGTDEFDTLGLGRFRSMERLGLKTDRDHDEISATNSVPAFVVKPGEASRSQGRKRTSLVIGTIALAGLVLLFWAALTPLANIGFELVWPNLTSAQ